MMTIYELLTTNQEAQTAAAEQEAYQKESVTLAYARERAEG